MRQVNKVRKKLKMVMKENGHTQMDVCYKLKINKSTMSFFLSGKTGLGGPHMISVLEYIFPSFRDEMDRV